MSYTVRFRGFRGDWQTTGQTYSQREAVERVKALRAALPGLAVEVLPLGGFTEVGRHFLGLPHSEEHSEAVRFER